MQNNYNKTEELLAFQAWQLHERFMQSAERILRGSLDYETATALLGLIYEATEEDKNACIQGRTEEDVVR